MKSLFASLGNYDDAATLRCKNDKIENFFTMLGLSHADFPDITGDGNEAVSQALDFCISWLSPYYEPLVSDMGRYQTPLQQLTTPEPPDQITDRFMELFATTIDTTFKDDLKFLMVSAFEYSRSLYCHDIPNGTFSDDSASDDEVDHDGEANLESSGHKNNTKILEDFLFRKNIKKVLNDNARALVHQHSTGKNFNRVLSNWRTLDFFKENSIDYMSKTVCPQFLRRTDTGNKKASLNDSIFDIGVTFGLIRGHTPSSSPFIRPSDDYNGMPDKEKERAYDVLSSFLQNGSEGNPPNRVEEEKDRLDIGEFINNFSSVYFDDKHHANRYIPLHKILEKYPVDGTCIPNEEFILMENFITERITNYNYLAKLFKLHNWLQENFREAELYLKPLFTELMLLPLPRTRNLIIDGLLKTLKSLNTLEENRENPFEYFISQTTVSVAEFSKKLFSIVRKWNRVTVQMAVLLFHHFMGAKPLQTTGYFRELYNSGSYVFFYRSRKNINDAEKENLIEKKRKALETKSHTEAYKRRFETKVRKSLRLEEISKGTVEPIERIDDMKAFSLFADDYYRSFNNATLFMESCHFFEGAVISLSFDYNEYIGTLVSALLLHRITSPGEHQGFPPSCKNLADVAINTIINKRLDYFKARKSLDPDPY